MSARLVYATRWEQADGAWRVRLLVDSEPGGLVLERDGGVSFKIGKGRFCVGHSRVTMDYTTVDSWKKRIPCFTSSLADSGSQCRACAASDASQPCARCTGESCSAHPSVKEKCEHSEAYVYLAVFGDRVKAGVSQGRRVEKRWIEQGADAARRVIVANGREARVYEKRIQDELGALKGLKADKKMTFTDPRELEWGLRSLEEQAVKVRSLLPSARHVDEETTLLGDAYGLPQTHVKPIEVKVRDKVAVSGKILGAKGPILFLDNAGITYVVNLHAIVGRRISSDLTGSRPSQSGLGAYFRN